MRRPLAILFVLAGAVSGWVVPLQASETAPVPIRGHRVGLPPEGENCVPREVYERLQSLARERLLQVRPESVEEAQLFPLYDWPLQHLLSNSLIVVNYVDEDSTPGVHDYQNLGHAYDGHNGTDLGLLSFRDMDRGERVIAGAPGTVADVRWTKVDRNSTFPSPDDGNWVFVDDGDGTYTYYFHLRRNSATVNLGESVSRGQMLGLMGSSGYSSLPHLHFEAGWFPGGFYRKRDPWNGPNNAQPSLWSSQAPYVGNVPFRCLSLQTFTERSGGGNIWNVDYTNFMNKLSAPVVMGVTEPYFPLLLQFQGNIGDKYTVELRRPDNSVYSSFPDSLTYKDPYGWTYWINYFEPYVTAADTGNWIARIISGGVTQQQITVKVGATTVFGPRFFPLDGRSMRVEGTVQKDTLRVSPLGGPVTYSLLGAPSWVTLADSVVTFPAVSPQPFRSCFFQAVCKDGASRRDTLWYHVVDPSKPVGSVTGAGEGAPGRLTSLLLSRARPNPSRASITMSYSLPAAGPARIQVFDASGRRVRTLLDGPEPGDGMRSVTWDGSDSAGRRAGAGIYFVRLESAGQTRVRKVALLR